MSYLRVLMKKSFLMINFALPYDCIWSKIYNEGKIFYYHQKISIQILFNRYFMFLRFRYLIFHIPSTFKFVKAFILCFPAKIYHEFNLSEGDREKINVSRFYTDHASLFCYLKDFVYIFLYQMLKSHLAATGSTYLSFG
jgi:hypothetical protein